MEIYMEMQFSRIVVLADGESEFTAQLTRRAIGFILHSASVSAVTGDPDLIIVINRGIGDATKCKQRWPQAQVIHCQGGQKNFSPRVRVIFGKDCRDTYWFRDWDQFIEIIGQFRPARQKLIEPTDEWNIFRPTLTGLVYAPSDLLGGLFRSMLAVSATYLDWYLQWLLDVSGMSFNCAFNLPVQRKPLQKRSRVTLPLKPEYTYKGMPVFRPEAEVNFFDSGGNIVPAVVDAVLETEIRFSFIEHLPIGQINDLVSFEPVLSCGIPEQQAEMCRQVEFGRLPSLPLAVIAGNTNNAGARQCASIFLKPDEARMFEDDDSQQHALLDIASQRAVSVVQGPAGTGKTFLSSRAVRQFLKKGRTIILISHSNRGLDALVHFVEEATGVPDQIFRLGNDPESVASDCLHLHRSEREWEGMSRGHDEPHEKAQVIEEVDAIRQLSESGRGVIIACTMASFLTDKTLSALRQEGMTFEIAFVDEASRGHLYELLPIVSLVTEKVIFIGDPDQLGNLEITPDARRYLEEHGHSESDIRDFSDGWFNVVLKQSLLKESLLCINRRSLPAICDLVSKLFYGGRLIVGRFDPANYGQVEFDDTSATRGKAEQSSGTSFFNPREANLAVKYVVKHLRKGGALDEIGIITPYRAQIELIRGRLRQAFAVDERLATWRTIINFDQLDTEDLLNSVVNTVDAFQGSQRRIIILSMVRSNAKGDIGFNRNVNRLRVAFSRAQDRLVVLGDMATFVGSDSEEVRTIFSVLAEYSAALGTYRKLN